MLALFPASGQPSRHVQSAMPLKNPLPLAEPLAIRSSTP